MRKRSMSCLIFSLFFVLVNSVETLPVKSVEIEEKETVENYREVNDIIKEKAEVLIDKYNAASVQYAISIDDKIITSDNVGVYSKSENRILMNDNMYGIGSVSKMYVTTAVMQLVDEGKIDLDMPLTTYISEFKMASEDYKKITPRMLLNHSSGLMGTTGGNSILFNDNDTKCHDNLLKELSVQKLKAEPGEFSVYCNDGFSLAEILVERVSGMNFSEYVRKNFSHKLGLENTKTPLDEFNRNDLAKTYTLSDFKEDPVENVNYIAAGGIYSNAEDMCRFANAITRKDNMGILSEKSVSAMGDKEYLKGVWVTDGEDNCFAYGLGWDSVNMFPFNRYGIKAYCKGGDTYCYHSCMMVLPDYGISMAVVSSGASSTVDEAFATQALLKVLKEKGIINEIKSKVNWQEEKSQSMPAYLKEYSGLYNVGNGILKVDIKDDGQLILSNPFSNVKSIYYHTYSGYFMKEGGNNGIRFVKEKNGITYIEQKLYIDYQELGQSTIASYFGQKVEENNISAEEMDSWSNRQYKLEFVVNDKYSSVSYALGLGYCVCQLGNMYSGYFTGNIIDDCNSAQPCVKLPIYNGRDLTDIKFSKEDNNEYVDFGSIKTISYDSIPNFNSDIKKVKIEDNGYTKWYKVPKEMVGKTISVKSSDNTSFNTYSANCVCLNDSYISGNKTVTLNDEGYIAFAGDRGETFEISIN